MLVENATTLGFPGEADLFVTQAVLQYVPFCLWPVLTWKKYPKTTSQNIGLQKNLGSTIEHYIEPLTIELWIIRCYNVLIKQYCLFLFTGLLHNEQVLYAHQKSVLIGNFLPSQLTIPRI